VFDVDVAEGAPPLKLPMNKGDDPYDAAEIFLEKHQLPITYLEQVVEFIQQNTGGNGAHPSPLPIPRFSLPSCHCV
jgi:phospholipase A-2-activating protein